MIIFLSVAVLAPMIQGRETPDTPAPPPVVPVSSLRLLHPMGIPAGRLGIFGLYSGSIMLLDAKSFFMAGPFLNGQLGTASYLRDVVLAKNGKTALLVNSNDKKIFFINLSKLSSPSVLGSVTLSFIPQGIALSPNQKYALVTGAAGNPKIASIDVKKRAVIQEYNLASLGFYAQSVTIARDNRTVIVGDFQHRAVLYFLMNPKTGTLGFINSLNITPSSPLNVAVSPDGKTVFAVCSVVQSAGQSLGPLFSISAPGIVAYTGKLNAPTADIDSEMGAVFSKDGKKLYVLTCLAADADGHYQHMIYVFNITAPGIAAYSGDSIKIHDFTDFTRLGGVDTMAIEPGGKFLFISNHTYQTDVNRIAVVDLKLNAHVLSLIPCDEGDIPLAIAFNRN